jgi:hypothetical protein
MPRVRRELLPFSFLILDFDYRQSKGAQGHACDLLTQATPTATGVDSRLEACSRSTSSISKATGQPWIACRPTSTLTRTHHYWRERPACLHTCIPHTCPVPPLCPQPLQSAIHLVSGFPWPPIAFASRRASLCAKHLDAPAANQRLTLSHVPRSLPC